MAKINPTIASAAIAVVIVVAILLDAPTVLVPAKASRGDAPAIVFTSDRGAGKEGGFDNIYRMNADGHGPAKKLTDIQGNNVMPAFSPDGSEIAYVHSGATGLPAIYRMNADGSGESSLISDLSFNTDPAWFPGGRRIVFSRNEDIYAAVLGSGGATKLIRLIRNAGADRQPAISPDGKKVAFVSDRDGDFDVYVMKVAPEGSANRPVKLTRNTTPDFAPDWAPAGGKLAFSSGEVGAREIYVMKAVPQNAETNPPINLTNDAADDSDPDWSPDGKQIAFTSDRTGNDEIWRMQADGTDPANLTNSPTSEDLQPDWAPPPWQPLN